MCKRGCLKFGRDQIIIRCKDKKKIFFYHHFFLKKLEKVRYIQKKVTNIQMSCLHL